TAGSGSRSQQLLAPPRTRDRDRGIAEIDRLASIAECDARDPKPSSVKRIGERPARRTRGRRLPRREGCAPSFWSAAELWHGASSRRRKIDSRAGRGDAGRIDGAMAAVIVPLDMVEVYRLGHAGHLIKRARVVP